LRESATETVDQIPCTIDQPPSRVDSRPTKQHLPAPLFFPAPNAGRFGGVTKSVDQISRALFILHPSSFSLVR